MRFTLSRREAVGLLLAGWAAPAIAQARPDYSEVTSLEIAARWAADGRLARILLFPAELGGEDVPPNVSYVPPAILPLRTRAIEELGARAQEGLIDRMNVNPDYAGRSFVPVRLRFDAGHSSTRHRFERVIEIWSPPA
ncbi:MAG TPA: hypothetical protein VEX35_02575 [Allosphingosinicella sp.]|nr:hypothetical protein [Allosphingosinicella sp.]